MPKSISATLSVLLLMLTSNLAAQQADPSTTPTPSKPMAQRPKGVIDYRQDASRAYTEKDYQGFREAAATLNQLRPYNSEYMYQLVLANALLNDKSAAYNTMLIMQRQGLSYDFTQTQDSANIRGTQVFDYLNELMVLAGQPMGEAEVKFQLPEKVLLPSAISWDERRESFLVSTIRDGAVFAVGFDGNASELLRANLENGMWGIHDMIVDSTRNRFWISSAASPLFSGFKKVDAGRSALFEFRLDSLELVKRYPVPVDGRPHLLGGMVMTPDGDIYVVDRVLPILYRLQSGQEKLQPFVASPDMVSMRGIAVSDDGTRLYIADYEMGIKVINLQSRTTGFLKVPETLNLGGIEGLFYRDGYLILIQNGIKPQRIMRLKLAEGGTAVSDIAPLAVAQPFFAFPTYGTVVADDLYFFANSHALRDMNKLTPVRVARVNLAKVANIVPPDMQKFLRDSEARKKAQESGN